MTTILQLTDVHLRHDGASIFGIDPTQRLTQAIDRVLADFRDVDLVVFSGDLTDEGHPDAYAIFQEQAARLTMPWIATIGNHDLRENFAAVYPQFMAEDGFAQMQHALPGVDVLLLDTKQDGSHAGIYCETRRAWLREALANTSQKLAIFMHHNPLPLGIQMLDAIMMENPGAIYDELAAYKDRICFLAHGHTHRTTFANWGGISVMGQRSLVHQAPLCLTGAPYVIDTSGALSLFRIDRDNTLIHHEVIAKHAPVSQAVNRIDPV